MESDKLNRWLTLGANLGVLIGIFLLVIELDQNRQMIRAQTRNAISNQIVERLDRQGTDTQVVNLVRRAEAGEELSADEARQHSILFAARARSWENMHYQYRHGMFDEEEFTAELNAWRDLINHDQSFGKRWCPTRHRYSPSFVAELESLFEQDLCGLTGHEPGNVGGSRVQGQ